MAQDRWFNIGITGLVITALCCFTPVLVWLLAGVGLAGFVAWLDPILLPLLAVFAAVTAWGLWQRSKARAG